jgi:hypothetical protein
MPVIWDAEHDTREILEAKNAICARPGAFLAFGAGVHHCPVGHRWVVARAGAASDGEAETAASCGIRGNAPIGGGLVPGVHAGGRMPVGQSQSLAEV